MQHRAMSRAIPMWARSLALAACVPATAHADSPSPWTGGPPPAPAEPAASDPFAFADFTWLTGNPRTTESPLGNDVFTAEIRVDTQYLYSFNHPEDDTISGSSESFRANEIQLNQIGVGGDFHYKGARARLMTQLGLLSTGTPRNDASVERGQYDLADAYRAVSEAYGGYHLDALHGINLDAGIFVSYIGMYSFYQFDNWAYQPSYVSEFTPWYFEGARVQIFLTDKLKIEPWLINGWQSYGRFDHLPGFGGQVLYRPTGAWSLTSNNYMGADTVDNPGRIRIHTDDSVQYKAYDAPNAWLDKLALAFVVDAGCETGGGVHCGVGNGVTPSQFFVGFAAYARAWFAKDHFALTFGGGAVNNPGRYLVLLPPINGATAVSGTPYFPVAPGEEFAAWDTSLTFDYMPIQFVTFRLEGNHRAADVPYFSGPGGVTPPGGNQGDPGSYVPGWAPDLVKTETRVTIALLVKL
jgi:hypothetical protein